MLKFTKTKGVFSDRFSAVSVFQVTGGTHNFAAFVYTCRLNRDLDGAPTTYGYDRPGKGSPHLMPLERSHGQKVGLGNACGDPGDGTKGWKNFLHGSRNFYWAGVAALTKEEAKKLNQAIDDRAELEAGLAAHGGHMKPVGMGYFPVLQPTGYYVSTTSTITDASLSKFDPARYLDSTSIPYTVWASHWGTISIGGKHVRRGDCGLAIQNATGAATPYVYGDGGTTVKVGESSDVVWKALGGDTGPVTFIAFPGSGSGTALGKYPNFFIRSRVLMNTLRLQKDASELAKRLAMGPDLSASDSSAHMNARRLMLYKHFVKALSGWTITG